MGDASHVRFDPVLPTVANLARPDDTISGCAVIDARAHFPSTETEPPR